MTNKIKNNHFQPSQLDNALSKKVDRKAYFAQRYQAKKKEWHEWYLKRKVEKQKIPKPVLSPSPYSQASQYKILLSLKEYTQLNKEKMKRWSNFIWTFKDLNQTGFHDIIQIMKIRELAENLINDYWTTAKNELKRRSRSWNSLDYDEQQRLIRYWGYEKTRVENGYIEEEERLEKQSREYLKEIELTKLHEERGKINCECWHCEEKKRIQAEIKQERKKIIEDYEKGQKAEKEQCPECGRWVKELDEENGICKQCMENYA